MSVYERIDTWLGASQPFELVQSVSLSEKTPSGRIFPLYPQQQQGSTHMRNEKYKQCLPLLPGRVAGTTLSW